MATDGSGAGSSLSPDEAFSLLGNATRIEILQALSGVDGPLAFSELRERVAVSDSGQFNYHLDKLTGHFVRQTAEGYALRRAGERVVEAVLSGAVTDAPVLEPVEVEEACPFCGAAIEASFAEERVEFYCTECAGTFDPTPAQASFEVEDYGFLGRLSLPPAGLNHRSPEAVVEAARVWGELEVMAMSLGVCPRCSAAVDLDVQVCESHDAGDGRCEHCSRRYAVNVSVECTNCSLDVGGLATVGLAGKTPYLGFQAAHGLNPITSGWRLADYEETVHAVDPFEAAFTFTLDGDELRLTVDEELTVVDATVTGASGPE